MGATVSAITSGVGKKSGLSGILNQALSLSVSTALSTFNEFNNLKKYGAMNSSYSSMLRSDMGAFGDKFGGLLVSAAQEVYQDLQSSDATRDAVGPEEWGKEANETDQERRASDGIKGFVPGLRDRMNSMFQSADNAIFGTIEKVGEFIHI